MADSSFIFDELWTGDAIFTLLYPRNFTHESGNGKMDNWCVNRLAGADHGGNVPHLGYGL